MATTINCILCDSKYKSKIWLDKHIIEKHTGIECNFCNVKIDGTIIAHHKCDKMEISKLQNNINLLNLEISKLKGNIQGKDELISTTVSSLGGWDMFSKICGSRGK